MSPLASGPESDQRKLLHQRIVARRWRVFLHRRIHGFEGAERVGLGRNVRAHHVVRASVAAGLPYCDSGVIL